MACAKAHDLRLLSLVESLRAQEIVPEAQAHHNACGAGAVAAMLAAACECGATAAQLLRHTSSHETLAHLEQQKGDVSVGYAAVAVG
jgi:AmmeMemoRadiSam system protein B